MSWVPAARLGMALAKAGFTVDAVCPLRHPIRRTHATRRTYPYSGLRPLRSVRSAINDSKPAIVIPGDDLAMQQLHRVYEQELASGAQDSLVRAIIERSLGAPGNIPLVYTRCSFMKLAKAEGVRVPRTTRLDVVEDLDRWAAQGGFPVVLKTDGSFGGFGVRVAHTIQEAQLAFRELRTPALLARAAKRAVCDRDTTLVWPAVLRRRPTVNAQEFVQGREATSAIACWKGKVLAALHFEVVKKAYEAGPATVLRVVEDTEMSAAAEKMIRRLNLSGMHGFDFMRAGDGGNTYLIEMNPRATQVGHLALGPGRDLSAALYSAVRGTSVLPGPRVTENDTIALCPHEWLRDPNSPYLQSAYHDVPWEEPDLVAACGHGRLPLGMWRAQANAAPAVPKAWLTNAP